MRRVTLLTLLLASQAWATLPRVCILGDSIQAGVPGVRLQSSVPSVVLGRLGHALVQNLSAPGATICNKPPLIGGTALGPTLWFLKGWFGTAGDPHRSGGLLIMLGRNDWAGDADPMQFAADYAALLQSAPPGLP